MKGRVLALDTLAGREAAALVVDGRLEDLLIDAPEDGPPAPGAIYRATVARPMKGQGGVFVAFPDGTGFLRRIRGVSPGATLLVQVAGYAEPGKAVPVATRLMFKSRYAIVTPGAPGRNLSRGIGGEAERDRLLEVADTAMADSEHGLILRSAADGVAAEAVAADIAAMLGLADDILAETAGEPACLLDGPGARLLAWRDWAVPEPGLVADHAGAFDDHGVREALDRLRAPVVALPAGASMTVEPTRALTAVDVNTGGDTSPAAGLKANLAAVRALPRALRLRGLGGQVTVDFAPMPKKDRRQLEQTLGAALRADPVETTLAGWTPLGHVELQRKRDRLPLTESLPG